MKSANWVHAEAETNAQIAELYLDYLRTGSLLKLLQAETKALRGTRSKTQNQKRFYEAATLFKVLLGLLAL